MISLSHPLDSSPNSLLELSCMNMKFLIVIIIMILKLLSMHLILIKRCRLVDFFLVVLEKFFFFRECFFLRKVPMDSPGFEPGTSAFPVSLQVQGQRSNQLSYEPFTLSAFIT